MTKVLVFYHYPCPDGAIAAALFETSRFVDDHGISEVHYEKWQYGKTQYLYHKSEHDFSHIFFLDCSPPRVDFPLDYEITPITVVDHHETAKWLLDVRHTNVNVHFSETECATKQMLLLRSRGIDPVDSFWKNFVEAVDRYDRHDNHTDRDECAYKSFGKEHYDDPRELYIALNDYDTRWSILEQGKVLFKHFKSCQKGLVNNAFSLSLADCVVNAVCMGETETEMINEVLHELAKSSPHKVGCSIFIDPAKQEVKLSFRGIGDDTALKCAKFYGGGGHAQAAGALLKGKVARDFIKNLTEQKYSD